VGLGALDEGLLGPLGKAVKGDPMLDQDASKRAEQTNDRSPEGKVQRIDGGLWYNR
jgi:hypothetical protein